MPKAAQQRAGAPRPFADRGKRLRARRKELQQAGRLQSQLATIAAAVGVSVSGFQQWERGETWPRDKKRAKLAAAMGWSESELDHGPQEAQEGKAQAVSSHPISPEELEVLALYRGLDEDRPAALDWLRSRVYTRHALKQNVRGDLKPVVDTDVERKMPVTAKNKQPSKKLKGS